MIGELALGSGGPRPAILVLLRSLPRAVMATEGEVMDAIGRHALHGTGIGYVDAHLLAATLLTPDAALWTRDRKLAASAFRLGVGARMNS